MYRLRHHQYVWRINAGSSGCDLPIIASYPVFTLLSVWAVRAERISGRLVLGVLMVTAGVVVIALVGGAG